MARDMMLEIVAISVYDDELKILFEEIVLPVNPAPTRFTWTVGQQEVTSYSNDVPGGSVMTSYDSTGVLVAIYVQYHDSGKSTRFFNKQSKLGLALYANQKNVPGTVRA